MKVWPDRETWSREGPIIFSDEMVRAILDGRKTQTRRIMKPQPDSYVETREGDRLSIEAWFPDGGGLSSEGDERLTRGVFAHGYCPFGMAGDHLYVKQIWAYVPATAYRHSIGIAQTVNPSDPNMAAIYKEGFDRSNGGFCWEEARYMPKWAARIWLEITSVRVERVQDISEEDIEAEGIRTECGPLSSCGHCNRAEFEKLWDRIHGPGAWKRNDFCWVIGIKRIEQEANG